jgi:hypothetical protein
LLPYARALDEQPAVRALIEVARSAPPIPTYDDQLKSLGGDPLGALRAARP